MSLFGSLMGDVEEDPFFGSHMRTMRQMNNMMSSLFADPFGMMGGGPLAIGGPRHHGGSSMMPFMPQMPSLDRLFSGDLHGGAGAASSFSSSTVIMSNGPGGKPQIISQSSSTKVGPNGIKETRKTLQDTRTGTKKMAIGHHIGERAHVIEREQNFYSGDAEERQEFINIDEEEAEDFDREFHTKAGSALTSRGAGRALPAPRRSPPPAPLLALPAAPSTSSLADDRKPRPAPRRPLRASVSPLASGSLTVTPMQLTTPPPKVHAPHAPSVPLSPSGSVRETYGSSHPQRHRHKHHKSHRQHDN